MEQRHPVKHINVDSFIYKSSVIITVVNKLSLLNLSHSQQGTNKPSTASKYNGNLNIFLGVP